MSNPEMDALTRLPGWQNRDLVRFLNNLGVGLLKLEKSREDQLFPHSAWDSDGRVLQTVGELRDEIGATIFRKPAAVASLVKAGLVPGEQILTFANMTREGQTFWEKLLALPEGRRLLDVALEPITPDAAEPPAPAPEPPGR